MDELSLYNRALSAAEIQAITSQEAETQLDQLFDDLGAVGGKRLAKAVDGR